MHLHGQMLKRLPRHEVYDKGESLSMVDVVAPEADVVQHLTCHLYAIDIRQSLRKMDADHIRHELQIVQRPLRPLGRVESGWIEVIAVPLLHVSEALASACPREGVGTCEILAVVTIDMFLWDAMDARIAALEHHHKVASCGHLLAAMEGAIVKEPRTEALDNVPAVRHLDV